MEPSRCLSGLILAIFLSQGSSVNVQEVEENVFVFCNSSISRIEGTEVIPMKVDDTVVSLGKRILDPRGRYKCTGKDANENDVIVQIYYRMCQNCVELDSATLSGIVVADIIATLLLALGVYCFAGHETGRLSEAADTQVVMRNDQLYQPLRERNNDQYSSLGENWRRRNK
ncbi:PREDICTED: T-cell surface glycoprotein CD3 delta chain [Condylura cristata]|uniref:T-cell surface glycoprotein CD3 delta chain n=1 Tax=Condylura cristata TaxID=143302 RepID=UPI0003344A1B|nr:PREDICTED: T-cell surface glycoprotein CD3 delta chain [Condylura cristata]